MREEIDRCRSTIDLEDWLKSNPQGTKRWVCGAVDLFGNPPPPPARKSTVPRGHAWVPGTGPAGETCGSCRHYTVLDRWTRKCRRVEKYWTNGRGTDIRAGDAACREWEARE